MIEVILEWDEQDLIRSVLTYSLNLKSKDIIT